MVCLAGASLLAMASFFAATSHLLAATPAAEKSPNVVVFLADDLGYGDLGCHGHLRIRTPNLDAFARQGRAARAVLCGERRLLAVAVGDPDRPHAAPQRRLHLDRGGERGPSAHQRSRPAEAAEGRRLRHLPRRQVAPQS
jgi:hypothetical protein